MFDRGAVVVLTFYLIDHSILAELNVAPAQTTPLGVRRMPIRLIRIVALGVILLAHTAAADTLAKVKQRGEIVIGVKADFRPFGFIDPAGKSVGFEIDLATDIAARLQARLRTVPVTTSNRIEFLNRGNIDMILATMADNPSRRKSVGMIGPPYYEGGTSVIALKSLRLRDWESLRNRPVCGVTGAYYNKILATKFGAEIIAFAGVPEAQIDLLQGNCIAMVQDSSLIGALFTSGDPRWNDYEMPLPIIEEQKWAIAVPLEERDGPFGNTISAIITEWHRSGYLIELEQKWGLPPSAFLAAMRSAP